MLLVCAASKARRDTRRSGLAHTATFVAVYVLIVREIDVCLDDLGSCGVHADTITILRGARAVRSFLSSADRWPCAS
jgi:hypothetical protein